ncbi:MAG: DUF4124 domain-containing protein [Myxococcaceae bacterium]|nr:DUF4124 domain-containing protein [Myxococcaceae bacterium]
MRLLPGVALVLWVTAASAQVYTWTDQDGVVHYTDNPNSVPAKAKARVTEGAEISTVKSSAGPQAPVAVAVPPAPVSPGPLEDPGRLEREWRRAFRELNERIARLEDEIELDRKKVEEVDGLPVAARYQCVHGFGRWLGWGGLVPPVVGSGSSVSVGATSQGLPGFTVNGGVVVHQTTQVVNSGIATAPCLFTLNPEFERAKERLELNRKALVRAKGELADLDRRASFEAVPREWRR